MNRWLVMAGPVAAALALGFFTVTLFNKPPPIEVVQGPSYSKFVLEPMSQGIQVKDAPGGAGWGGARIRLDPGFRYSIDSEAGPDSMEAGNLSWVQREGPMVVGDVIHVCGPDATMVLIDYPALGATLYDGSLWGVTRCD